MCLNSHENTRRASAGDKLPCSCEHARTSVTWRPRPSPHFIEGWYQFCATHLGICSMPPRAAAAALLLALLASFLPPALPQPATASDASSRVSRGPLLLAGGAQCNPEDEFEGATHIFNGWMERAAACLRPIETGTCNSMGHGMAYLTAARKLCAYKYSYNNGVFRYDAPKGNAACEHAVLQRRCAGCTGVRERVRRRTSLAHGPGACQLTGGSRWWL